MICNKYFSELSIFTQKKQEIFLLHYLTSGEIKKLPKNIYNFLVEANDGEKLEGRQDYWIFRIRRRKNGKVYIEYFDYYENKIRQKVYYEKFVYDYVVDNTGEEFIISYTFSDSKNNYEETEIPVINYEDYSIQKYNRLKQLKEYIDKGYVYTAGYLQGKNGDDKEDVNEAIKKYGLTNCYYELLETELDKDFIKKNFDKFPPIALKNYVEKNCEELLYLFEKQNKK